MLVTVTANPALDKLYYVEKLVPGEDIRVRRADAHAGGKGIDVAKVAKLLGEDVLATGFIGGHTGNFILEALQQKGINEAFVRVKSETRVCVNVYESFSGKPTALLEPGAAISRAERGEMTRRFAALMDGCDMATICGSVPVGIGTDFYPELIGIAKAAGKQVVLDTSGALLKAGIEAKPDMIKPNRDEISELLGHPVKTLEEVADAAVTLRDRKHIANVIVSLGKDGALFATSQGVFRGTTPDIKPVNTVGCGDSMVAAFATGLLRRQPMADIVRLAMAVSTANALGNEAGYFQQEDLDRIYRQVEAIPLDGGKA